MFERAPFEPGKREPMISTVTYEQGPLLLSSQPADPVRGALLRALREAAGLSLLEAANAIGCTPSGLSSVERGWFNLQESEWARLTWLIQRARKGGAR